MKTTIRIALGVLLLAGCTAWNAAQEKVESKITIVLPARSGLYEDTVVKVNGKKIDVSDDAPVFKAAIEKGKEEKFTIVADIQPNNYTHLFRTREVTLKAGDSVKVDMTIKDKKTDKITVRWVPTPDDIIDEMCKLGKCTKDDVVYDLGCGDSVMLIRPIQKFGAKRGVGIDIDQEMVDKSLKKIKAAGLEKKIEVRKGDILDVKDMSDASLVLLYIGDDLGERLGPVLQKTMKPGARIVSHRFSLGDWEPTKKITVKGADNDSYDLLLWIVPEKKLEKSK